MAEPSHLSETFTRRIVAPMAVTIIVAITLMLGFVIVTANGQNRLEVVSSTKLAETALAVNQRQIARNLKDYAVWEDVYRNLHVSLNTGWAATDGNVGANIFEGLGYEMAFVVSPAGETVYAVIEGVPQPADAFALIPHGLRALIRKSLDQPTPAVGILRSGGDITIVAATPILPPSIERRDIEAGGLSTLIFTKKLDAVFLSRMSEEYLLKGLRISAAAAPQTDAAIPLFGPDGENLGQLIWTPQTPGYELLRLLLPPFGIAIVVLAAFAWLVVNNARKSAVALEDSARTVESYAQILQESEARFRDVAEATSDWIWECDPELRLIYFSTRFAEVTGMAAASVLGKTLEQFFASDTGSDGWSQLLEGTLGQTSFRNLRCCYRDAAGHKRVCRLAGRPILDAAGAFIGYRGTSTDITEEVEAQARASHLALHDSLTGLPNRVLFRERLNQCLHGSRHDAALISVMCLDLDHFKEVNDTLGHGAGDALLRKVAARLRGCVRPADTVSRLGGDEFAIIQLGSTQPSEAEALSLRIIEVLKAPFRIEGQELHVGVSVGVALPGDLAGDTDNAAEKLLKSADIALYRAKQAGRGTVRFFEARMDDELQARKSLEYDLRHALSRKQFELHYQPLIDLKSQKVAAVEALLRWRHPVRGLISPDLFIPIAETCGLVASISDWVLRTACAQVLAWPETRIAVNLSPVQFRSRELIDSIAQALAETCLEAHRLELEITESVLIKDTETALEILNGLKAIGVNIAMDDFGTGYSSLGYLNSFPFDKIKIDRSFISSLNEQDKSKAIVRSVISLGESLNMITTAEGVETTEQVAFLIEEGCQQVQGFFFGRPRPAKELTEFLRNWKGFDLHGAAHAAA